MIFQRTTLAAEATFEGLGLHSGDPVRLVVRPGNKGIVFRSPAGTWAATPDNVSDTSRCTRLGEVSTIEHLMSAFCGLEITDAEVELDAGELPALDGAAAEYVRGLQAAGRTDLGQRELRDLFTRLFLQDGETKIAVASGQGHWRYEYITGPRWPGAQVFDATGLPAGYAEQIAPCRTFGLEEEIPHLHAMGLARGLDLSTALVLGRDGYVNDPKFPDEPARHKLLDCLGDLYLSGVPARFLSVVAERSGHRTNVAMAAKLRAAVELV